MGRPRTRCPGNWGSGGEAPENQLSGEAGRRAQRRARSGSHGQLMELAVAGENAMAARKRVRRNKGSPGIDGRTVEELAPYLREHWPRLREALLAGTGTYFERLGVPRLAAATSTH